jgi:hypothetical protein
VGLALCDLLFLSDHSGKVMWENPLRDVVQTLKMMWLGWLLKWTEVADSSPFAFSLFFR